MPLIYTKYYLIMILAATMASLFIPALNVSAQPQRTNQAMPEDVAASDSVTLLLESQSVSAGAHTHLYDTGIFHITNVQDVQVTPDTPPCTPGPYRGC